MSFGIALASGFIREKNLMDKERRKAESDAALRSEEFDTAVKLAKEQSAIDFDRATRVADYNANIAETTAAATWTREASKRDREAFFTSFDKLTDAQKEAAFKQPEFVAQWKKYTGVGFSDDFVKTANAMADVDDTSTIPGTTLSLPWDISTETPDNRNALFVQNMNGWGATNVETVLKHIKDNPTEAGAILAYMDQTMLSHKTSEYNAPTETERHILDAYKFYPEYMRLRDKIYEVSIDPETDTLETTLNQDIEIITKGKGLGENQIFVSHAGTASGTKGGSILTLEKEEFESLNSFANVLYPGRDASYLMNNAQALMPPGTTSIEAIEGIQNAARLYDAGIMNLTSITPDPQKVDAVSDILVEIGGPENTLSKQVAAVYPIFAKSRKFEKYDLPGVISDLSGADYLGTAKAAAISKRYSSAEKAVKLATWLRQNRLELGTAGITRRLQEVSVGLFSRNGTVDQLSSFFTANPENLQDGTTGDSINKIYTDYLKNQGGNVAGLIGETRVLEFNLAVQIARAADENGRLSNQDFENALKTLGTGGLLANLESDIGALDTTIALYTDTRDSLKQKAIIANKEKGQLTKSDLIELTAYETVKVGRARIKERNASSAMAADAAVLPTLQDIEGSPNIFRDYTSDYDVPEGSRFIYKKDDKSYFLVSPDNTVSQIEKGNLPAPRGSGGGGTGSNNNAVLDEQSFSEKTAILKERSEDAARQQPVVNTARIPASEFAGIPSKPAPGGAMTFEGKPGTYRRVKVGGQFFYEKVS